MLEEGVFLCLVLPFGEGKLFIIIPDESAPASA